MAQPLHRADVPKAASRPLARRSCQTLGPSEVSSVLRNEELRVLVLIASATSKSAVRAALRARNANRDSGARRAVRPSAASERRANLRAASHAASGNTPARHAGLSVLRRPAAERAETRRKSRCTSAFALGNGTSGTVQMPLLRQQRNLPSHEGLLPVASASSA